MMEFKQYWSSNSRHLKGLATDVSNGITKR